MCQLHDGSVYCSVGYRGMSWDRRLDRRGGRRREGDDREGKKVDVRYPSIYGVTFLFRRHICIPNSV